LRRSRVLQTGRRMICRAELISTTEQTKGPATAD
jgi:hypothetical protein